MLVLRTMKALMAAFGVVAASCLSVKEFTTVLESQRFLTSTNESPPPPPPRLDEVARFYRQNGSRMPRLKPKEVQWSLRKQQKCDKEDQSSGDLIATLRMCPRGYNEDLNDDSDDPSWIFLRALCVAVEFRRQGWALELLRRSIAQESARCCAPTPFYLFADPSLTPLYRKAGFVQMEIPTKSNNEDDSIQTNSWHLPRSLEQKYWSINRRRAFEGVLCFGCFDRASSLTVNEPPHRNKNSGGFVNLLLLQHYKEVGRKTGTATLLQPTWGGETSGCLASVLHVSNFTWTGRVDNFQLQEILENSCNQGEKVVLLWKGGTMDLKSVLSVNCDDSLVDTTTKFVLLDGTWQEAQSMFRKIPCLSKLPRLSIRASRPSQYRLRGDYGWKERFGRCDDGGQSLLCTVEVVAELLEQAGWLSQSEELRGRLQKFSFELGRPI